MSQVGKTKPRHVLQRNKMAKMTHEEEIKQTKQGERMAIQGETM